MPGHPLHPCDVRVTGAALYLLPVEARVPYRFGAHSLTHVTLARVALGVLGQDGRRAVGWGETPLSAGWAWPSAAPYPQRESAMAAFCARLAAAWPEAGASGQAVGHPLEIGHAMNERLPEEARLFDEERRDGPDSGLEAMPALAALVCASAFDLALHDAYGILNGLPIYEAYGSEALRRDLSGWLQPDEAGVSFENCFPSDFLLPRRDESLWAWHSVGLGDAIDEADLGGGEPSDGYPATLGGWIERDGLRCLKVKVRGDDPAWDFERLRRVGEVGLARGVEVLCADFNCTARSVESVCETLDRLRRDAPPVFEALLYVEQPFPDTPEALALDVRPISQRKPLFLDESAHDWRAVRLARRRGYTGVALKTCKTQSGALLSACWARAHGMPLMVQDLTNPMLAMIPHALLAAHIGTLRGLETNAPQFYPEASQPEARVHPGLYARAGGRVSLASVRGAGFGYRLNEVARDLPPAVVRCEV